jgi:hypothetical protein
MPCPAAFTVLLVCLQLKKVTLGFAIVDAFSFGLALTMVAAGGAGGMELAARGKTLQRLWRSNAPRALCFLRPAGRTGQFYGVARLAWTAPVRTKAAERLIRQDGGLNFAADTTQLSPPSLRPTALKCALPHWIVFR